MAQEYFEEEHPEEKPFVEQIRWIYEFARFEAEALRWQLSAHKYGDQILGRILEKLEEDELIENERVCQKIISLDDFPSDDLFDRKLRKRNRIRSQQTKLYNRKFKRSQS